MDLSPLLSVFLSARYSFLSLSCRNLSGSSGAGSDASPIRVLPGYRRSGCLYHRQFDPWYRQPSAHRHDLNGAAYRLVPGLVHHLRRFDICVAAGPVSDASHFQRHFRRIFSPNPPGLLRMKNDASFNDAKRLYLEQYGDPMVTNTYLKIALALLSVVCVALALIDLRTIRTFQNF